MTSLRPCGTSAPPRSRYREFGLLEPSLFVDRAKVLLGVRLLAEARATAEAAVAAYAAQGRDVHVPEALLLLSTVALVQGDTDARHGSRRGRGPTGSGGAGAGAPSCWPGTPALQADLVGRPGLVDPARVARAAR